MEGTREPVPAADDGAALSCDELALALVQAQRLRMAALRQALEAQAVHLHPAAVQSTRPLLDQVDAEYGALCTGLQAALRRSGRSMAAAMALRADKHEALERLRSLQGVAAALVAGVEWQSPSADHSRWSQAGTLTGRIVLTKNDYMRDHHAFADAYEQAWAAAYVDAPPQQRVHAFATSSGMAAFALAATRLFDGHGEVLAGEASWFQNKMLAFPPRSSRCNTRRLTRGTCG